MDCPLKVKILLGFFYKKPDKLFCSINFLKSSDFFHEKFLIQFLNFEFQVKKWKIEKENKWKLLREEKYSSSILKMKIKQISSM